MDERRAYPEGTSGVESLAKRTVNQSDLPGMLGGNIQGGGRVIVNIEFRNGGQKIIPLVDTMSIKEYHLVIFQEDGKVDTIERSKVEKVRIVGV